jgi:tetratricopeptide (TPR) repeat protein
MIVVEPPAARFETGEAASTNDEHLLERISSLENRLSRLTEKLEHGLDLLLRQAQNSYFDRALVKALIGLLTEDGVVQSERLERLWNDRCQKDAAEHEEIARREGVRLKILNSRANDSSDFEQLINEGFLLLEDNQSDLGIKALQRAADAGPPNFVLLSFLGEHHFKAGRTRLARGYLSRAHAVAPGDIRLSLLLGLTCADEGDIEQAKELLSNTTRQGGSSFAAHYGLGRVFAAEADWRGALREFKLALNIRPSPEAHYVLACLYYQLNRDSLALRHLRKALAMDQTYSEALHLLGLIHRRAGNEELAREAFEAASAGDYLKRSGSPLFDSSVTRSRKLVTGGNPRLARTLREDALKPFATQDS